MTHGQLAVVVVGFFQVITYGWSRQPRIQLRQGYLPWLVSRRLTGITALPGGA